MGLFGKKEKKRFADTKVGAFLKEKAPELLSTIGGILPDRGGLGIIKHALFNDTKMSEEDRLHAIRLLDYEMQEIQEITKRWKSDSESDSWLAKNIRPLTLGYLMIFMTILIIADSIGNNFNVRDCWVILIETLLVTVVVAYFGGRTAEKYRKIKNN